jgi:phosphoglycerate kinase
MNLKNIASFGELRGKRVLVRCNFDVKEGEIHPGLAWRVDQSIPFLQELAQKGARTIILSHRGRPQGVEASLSLRPVFDYVKTKLPELKYFDKGEPKDGECMLLENLRFDPRERANDETFAEELAALGEVYINNDFANSHRAHASMIGIPKLIPSAAGPLLAHEIEELDKVRNFRDMGLVFVMGGAKTETKLKLIGHFLSRSDAVLLGGVLANTLLRKRGHRVGRSVIDTESDLTRINAGSQKLLLPIDVVVSHSLERPVGSTVKAVEEMGEDEYIVDIGPKTQTVFRDKIKNAALVVWNGPLGLSEVSEFAEGSRAVLEGLSETHARKIAGGSDTISFLAREKGFSKLDFVSTGGGAMLVYLAGEPMPGIEALKV